MTRAGCVAALVAPAVLLIAGCGSTELSDKQLRARATRVCAIATRQAAGIRTPESPAGGAAFLDKGIAVLEPEYRQLKALHPPSDLDTVYKISINSFSRKLAALKIAARHLHDGGDPAIAMKTLQQHLAPLESSEDGAWEALQVPACVTR